MLALRKEAEELLDGLADVPSEAAVRERVECSAASVGSVVATALWLVGSLGFSVYVGNFGLYGKTYGSPGRRRPAAVAVADGVRRPVRRRDQRRSQTADRPARHRLTVSAGRGGSSGRPVRPTAA
jgi:hypothetical protein